MKLDGKHWHPGASLFCIDKCQSVVGGGGGGGGMLASRICRETRRRAFRLPVEARTRFPAKRWLVDNIDKRLPACLLFDISIQDTASCDNSSYQTEMDCRCLISRLHKSKCQCLAGKGERVQDRHSRPKSHVDIICASNDVITPKPLEGTK